MRTGKKIITAVCFALCLTAVFGFFGDDILRLARDAACISTVFALPALTTGDNGQTSNPYDTASSGTQDMSSVAASESTVPAIANHGAVGAVISRVLSPYSANLKYDKIFINNKTPLKIDLKKEYETAPKLSLSKTVKPQVLIIHTHATESYMTDDRNYYTDKDATRTTDIKKSVVAVGDIIENKLKAAGIGVIHDHTLHDQPSYTGSYERAAVTTSSYLKSNPSIKVVLDIHRDSISSGDKDKVKPTVTINGKKAAQVMLVLGSESGSVKNFPNWKENFRLGIRIQQKLETNYPNLARSAYFASKKYNQNLSTGSMIIEVGTEANTLNEAKYSGELIANALAEVLKGFIK